MTAVPSVRSRPTFILFVLALLPAFPARGHPVHTSLAEADYNRSTRSLEVALRVFADDFEARLSERAQRPVSLEKTPAREFDRLIQDYLATAFTVRTRDGGLVALRWVGREAKEAANELWLYFEAPLPAGLEGVRLRHALLVESFRDQLNSIRVRDQGRSATLLFFPDRGEKEIPTLR